MEHAQRPGAVRGDERGEECSAATGDDDHAQWNASALAKHVEALAAVAKRRVIVVSKEGETWEFGSGRETRRTWPGTERATSKD